MGGYVYISHMSYLVSQNLDITCTCAPVIAIGAKASLYFVAIPFVIGNLAAKR